MNLHLPSQQEQTEILPVPTISNFLCCDQSDGVNKEPWGFEVRRQRKGRVFSFEDVRDYIILVTE